ncbi:MAG: sulfatase-like hydrolase/transferase [Acidobacteriota bacterium]|nr:sulfatase-like hydrolase/transferase [Acidobacteriota bacterium]MDH3523899.1 sulfatase-like hydrolase/transferase [Acidobacteriota bacterium]
MLLTILGCGASSRPFDTIFVVTIDTLRADHLGCYGYPRPVSPFIDSMAARGVRFERVVSSSSHTGPAHASLFTSHHPASHRVLVNGVDLQDGIPTMAGLLAAADFETAAFLSVDFLRSVTHGFDVVDADTRGERGHRRAESTVDAALEWLAGREIPRRAFVWVHLFDVHQTQRRHRVARPGLEARMEEDAKERAAILQPHWTQQHGLTAARLRRLLARINRYDAQLSYVDAELRRLVETADAGGRRNLWIVTSDHGEGLGDHGYPGHGKYLYQAQLEVPLIFYGGDGWPPGAAVDDMVRHVDVLPTVLELAGVAPPSDAGFEGRSLVRLLESPSAAAGVRYAFSQRRPPNRPRLDAGWPPGLVIAAQSERYKYILSTDREDEFYDLEADPRELNNLIGEEIAAKDELLRWMLRKYEAMAANPLAPGGEIEEEYLEELKALGYL